MSARVGERSRRTEENRGLRLGLSVIVAVMLAGMATSAFGLVEGERWLLVGMGVPTGVLLLLPLRYRTREWRAVWWWQGIPAAAALWLLTSASATAAASPTIPFLLTACAVLFAGTLVKPIAPPADLGAPVIAPCRPEREPPWPPDSWTQEEWDRWWDELCEWNEYRVRELREPVALLSPPPPLPSTLGMGISPEARAAWWAWRQEWLAWDAPARETEQEWFEAAEAAEGFPPGWTPISPDDRRRCVVCADDGRTRGVPRATCPECENVACRSCLAAQKDDCPSCTYNAARSAGGSERGRR